jgi:hypothetical protein
MPSTQRQGFVGNGEQSLHAARPALLRLVALCGMGRIVQEVPGLFDPTDRLACPKCASMVEQS